MATITHGASAAVRRNLPKVRSLLTLLFLRVVAEARGTHSAAARWMGIAPRTLRRRIARKSIPIDRVLATPQLGERFRRALCTEGHQPAPYVARKRSGRKAR